MNPGLRQRRLRRFGFVVAAVTGLAGTALAVYDVGPLAFAILVWGLAAVLAAFAVWTPHVHEPLYRAGQAILGWFRRDHA